MSKANIKADARFGLLRDAFVSHGENHNVRVTGFTVRPDLSVCFELSLNNAAKLGEQLVKFVKERRESTARIRKSLQRSQGDAHAKES